MSGETCSVWKWDSRVRARRGRANYMFALDQPPPEIIELDGIEERERLHYLGVVHVEKPASSVTQCATAAIDEQRVPRTI